MPGFGDKVLKVMSLTRWTCFETRMPFYSLNVSGYQSLLFKARKITVGDDGESKMIDNKFVTL